LYAETARPNRIKKPVAVINDSLCGIQFVDNKREFFVPDRKRLGQLEAIVYTINGRIYVMVKELKVRIDRS